MLEDLPIAIDVIPDPEPISPDPFPHLIDLRLNLANAREQLLLARLGCKPPGFTERNRATLLVAISVSDHSIASRCELDFYRTKRSSRT